MALEELSSHESRLPPPSPATSLPPSAALGADGEPPPEEETVGGLGADGRQLGQAGAALPLPGWDELLVKPGRVSRVSSCISGGHDGPSSPASDMSRARKSSGGVRPE